MIAAALADSLERSLAGVTPRKVAVIGVPTSAGAFAPGQEQAPQALRAARLLEALDARGVTATDLGDCETWRWRADPRSARAQNLGKVVEVVGETAARVRAAAEQGQLTLVLGGDCTVGIGTVAGQLAAGRRIGLVYFDMHADLNVPASVSEGALDWMGVAHMLGVDGAEPTLVHVGARAPLLEPWQIVLLGWAPTQATAFERDAISRHELTVLDVERVARDPARAVGEALETIESRCDALVVHFDVDVIDFTDAPLSENPGRNVGLTLEQAMLALVELLHSRKLAGVTVTELNPDHAEPGGGALTRLVDALATGLAGAP